MRLLRRHVPIRAWPAALVNATFMLPTMLLPGVLVARVDGPLFFTHADRFRTTMRAQVARGGAPRAGVLDEVGTNAVHDTVAEAVAAAGQSPRPLAPLP